MAGALTLTKSAMPEGEGSDGSPEGPDPVAQPAPTAAAKMLNANDAYRVLIAQMPDPSDHWTADRGHLHGRAQPSHHTTGAWVQ